MSALIVPKTSDGRVIFVIPWHDAVIVGTTDTPIAEVSLEPAAQQSEIKFLLDTASEYLEKRVEARRRAERFCRHTPSGQQRLSQRRQQRCRAIT